MISVNVVRNIDVFMKIQFEVFLSYPAVLEKWSGRKYGIRRVGQEILNPSSYNHSTAQVEHLKLVQNLMNDCLPI
jgi:hypothetical protein